MVAQNAQHGPGWPRWLVAWVIFVVAFAVYWPLRTEYLYEGDSVNFALCVRQHDIDLGDPHPPGYPLWLLMVSGVTWLVGTPNTAMILLSIGFTAAGAFFLYLLALRLQGGWGAAFIVGLLLFTPNVILHSATATTYTVDLCTAALLGWFAARLWEGESRLAPWAAGVAGLLAGIRLAGVVLMTPLLAYALVVACRADWRLWLKTALFCVGAVSSWFFSVAYFGQGIVQGLRNFSGCSYWLFCYLAERSALGGQPAEMHLERLMRAGIWLGMSLVVPCCLLGCVWLVRRCARRDGGAAMPRPVWHCWPFYVLWLSPNLLMISLVLCLKPCYLNLSLPPLLLLIGNFLYANACTPGPDGTGDRRWPCMVTFGCFLLASTVLASYPFYRISSPRFDRFRHVVQLASLHNLRESDRALGELIGLVKARRDCPPRQMIIAVDTRWTELGPSKAAYYFPEYPVRELARDELPPALSRDWGIQPRGSPPAGRIWWILPRGASAEGIRAAFPQTGLVFEGRFTSLYSTQVDLQTFHALREVLGGTP